MDVSLGELRELVMDREALACCDSWGRKESDMTEQLNWTMEYSDFPGSSVVNNLPANAGDQVQSLGWENPLE